MRPSLLVRMALVACLGLAMSTWVQGQPSAPQVKPPPVSPPIPAPPEPVRPPEKVPKPRTGPEGYATTVSEAMAMIEQRYVAEVNLKAVLMAGVRNLYKQAGVEVPKEMPARINDAGAAGPNGQFKLLADIRRELGERKELNDHQDVDATLRGMVAKLDPRSLYVAPKTLQENRRKTLEGTAWLGLIVKHDKEEGGYKVAATVKDSPAYLAGLKKDDVLLEIHQYPNPEERKVTPFKGLPEEELTRYVNGPPGARVDIIVQGEKGPLTKRLKYEYLKAEPVQGFRRGVGDSWDYYIDRDSRIAYLRIGNLYSPSTVAELDAILARLSRGAGIRGLILDLRFNGGGNMVQAINIAERFISSGVISRINYRGGKTKVIEAKGLNTPVHSGFPMVCLVNRDTGSSAELIAAGLQDRGRAAILGERTFGKGSMQLHLPLDGGEFRLTNAFFCRPSGANLDREHLKDPKADTWGVIPDDGFEYVLNDADHAALKKFLTEREWIGRKQEFKDVQLDGALEWLRGQRNVARAP